MTTHDLDQEIEKTRTEIEGKKERLRELEQQREERRVERVDLEAFEEMTPSERRQLKAKHPEKWRGLMDQKRERAERRLESTPGHETF